MVLLVAMMLPLVWGWDSHESTILHVAHLRRHRPLSARAIPLYSPYPRRARLGPFWTCLGHVDRKLRCTTELPNVVHDANSAHQRITLSRQTLLHTYHCSAPSLSPQKSSLVMALLSQARQVCSLTPRLRNQFVERFWLYPGIPAY